MVVKTYGITQGRQEFSYLSTCNYCSKTHPLPTGWVINPTFSALTWLRRERLFSEQSTWILATPKPESPDCTNLGRDGPAALPDGHDGTRGDTGITNLKSE